jgi:hypothetical protein
MGGMASSAPRCCCGARVGRCGEGSSAPDLATQRAEGAAETTATRAVVVARWLVHPTTGISSASPRFWLRKSRWRIRAKPCPLCSRVYPPFSYLGVQCASLSLPPSQQFPCFQIIQIVVTMRVIESALTNRAGGWGECRSLRKCLPYF